MCRVQPGSTIGGAYANQDVVWIGLGVFHRDIEVAIFAEDARVHQFVLERIAIAPAILGDQVRIREGALGILIQGFHVRVARSVVEKIIILLDILAMVALRVRQAEEALLQDRVVAVPQGQGEAELLLLVTDAHRPSSPQR